MNRACTPSPRRTAGTRPSGTIRTAGTQGFDTSMKSHTLTNSIGTHRCSKRVYVVPHSSGRRKRAMRTSCQRAPTTNLPRPGETVPADGGGGGPRVTATLNP